MMNLTRLKINPTLRRAIIIPDIWIGSIVSTLIKTAKVIKICITNNIGINTMFQSRLKKLEIIPNPKRPSSPDSILFDALPMLPKVISVASLIAFMGLLICSRSNMKTNHATNMNRDINPIADLGRKVN